MIRLVVLGSSASMPSKERVPSCFAVKYGEVLLFDCCEAVQRQMMIYGVSYAKIKAIFITHLHADHFLGVFGLIQTMNFIARKEPLYIFGPKGTQKLLESVFNVNEMSPDFTVRVFDTAESAKPIFETPLFNVRAFEVEHGTNALGYTLQEKATRKFDVEKAEKIGVPRHQFSELEAKGAIKIKVGKSKKTKIVKIEDITFQKAGKKIVYTGDSMPCKSIEREAKEADLLIHDSCFAGTEAEAAKQKKHSTVVDAAQSAKKAGAKKLLLTHFSNRYDDTAPLLEEARKIFSETLAAKEGLEIMV